MDVLMNATLELLDNKQDEVLLKDIIAAIDQSVIVAITNAKGEILSVNKQFCEISQYTPTELIGKNHNLLNSGYHPKSFFKNMWATIGSGNVWEGEICNRAKNGSIYWVQTTIVPFMNEKGKPYQYISIRKNITPQKNSQRYEHLAYHDELTGLKNRRKLRMTYESMLKQKTESSKEKSIMFISINRFKIINEGFGYHIGDLFLVTVAYLLDEIVSLNGTVFQYIGDQFAIICKNEDRFKIINAILFRFNDVFYIDKFEFYSSVSIGITPSILQYQSFEEVIRITDIALSRAKENKGNYYVEYTDKMNIHFAEQLELEKKLRKAIHNQDFMLYYQPKYSTTSYEFNSVEALIRWHDKELGWISPEIFINLAEQLGLMTEIDEFVIETACQQAVLWRKQYNRIIKIAINISPLHLNDKNFVCSLEQIMRKTGCYADMIEIEITENSLIFNDENVIKTFEQLKNIGISIALDDFGKGYSSLSYLKNFPIDTLKIDREFIMGIQENSSEANMVKAIVGLGKIFNMSVVAEGVENKLEESIVQNAECDYIQGYYLCKPLPPQEIENLLLNTQK